MKINTITFYILSLFVIVFFVSCFQLTTNDKDKNKQNDNVDTLVSERFETFLKDFSQKPTFQRQRVLFPIEVTVRDPSEYGMETVKEMLNYQDWFLLDFSYDSTFRTRQMDRYNQNTRLYDDSALIEQRGIDNGIYANFLFAKKEGKWFLKSFTDISY